MITEDQTALIDFLASPFDDLVRVAGPRQPLWHEELIDTMRAVTSRHRPAPHVTAV